MTKQKTGAYNWLMNQTTNANLEKISWTNVAFLVGSPLALVLALVFGWVTWSAAYWPLYALTFVLWVFGSLGISGGYHRLFSHKSYEAHPLLRLFYLVFGAIAIENSALEWCTDHRRHHHRVDTVDDPYNIRQGFFHAHMGWIFFHDSSKYAHVKFNDLENDPLIRWQHRNYLLLAIGIGFMFPTLFGGWVASRAGLPVADGLLNGFFIGSVFRVVFMQHCTFFVNSLCHYFGAQPFTDQNTARDSYWFAFLTFGEGFHNFHHKYEFDYRNGIRWFDWDPTKWLVSGLSRVGMTWNLKRAAQRDMFRARLAMQEKRLVLKGQWNESVAHFKEKVEAAQEQFRKAWEQYQAARKESHAHGHETLEMLRAEFRKAKHEFEVVYAKWRDCVRAPHLVTA